MTRDPRLTKERLLAAATEEFAAHGIGEARVDRIAARAGVNKERIYGYFGNKQKLFDAVVACALDEVAEAVPLDGEDDPAEYVGRVYDFHRDNPVLVRLLLWEGLHYRNEALPGEDGRREHYADKTAMLAQSLGLPRTLGEKASAEVAPLLLTLIGLAVWPHTMPQMARLILGPAASQVDLREHVVEFARRALAGAPARI